MKKRWRYFSGLFYVIPPWIVYAFLNIKMSLKMLDVMNAAIDNDWTAFWNNTIWLFVFLALVYPMDILSSYASITFTKKTVTKMKSDYIAAVFGKDIAEFQKENNAAYLSAVTNDFAIIETDYISQIMEIVVNLIRFASAIIIFSIISPLILLVGIGIVLINGSLTIFIEKPVKKHNTERSVLYAEYNSFVKEVLSAFSIIKNNNLETRIRKNFYDKSEKVQQKRYIIDKLMSFVFSAQNAIGMSIFIGMSLFAVWMTMIGTVTFAGIIIIINNFGNLVNPMFSVAEAIPKFRSVRAIFIRIDKTLEQKNNHEETLPFNKFEHEITFKNVAFAYEDNPVVSHVDLTFEKGRKYLVIGPSGGGKSTLLRMLRKYFDPQEGIIEIDGNNLSDILKKEYFSKIANIEQTIFLFEDTIRNNLTLFKDYSEEEIGDAVKKAGLDTFIDSNPEGLDYMIYDNGKNISGGEKSRIAIARGLLNKAQIIFLDEAFASLDYDRAKKIEKTLLALDGVTVINVSHVVIPENKLAYDGICVVKNHTASMRLQNQSE
ncbi:MAG TPA: ABC transporter ATP-binding protein [Bacillota bacterium]|nr:ABC transporter ATP-binding protein [Bacillota bacterium]HPF43025.1 ABC transporter ATP-binding protein [Bacillota bacterium]HPJ86337.1 ABC transporter ATP-binding protein [Bacillota bacterium]HPQ61927.1 ABC transporter ATP-binding protein [Bacillota bacterium]HRX92210.1 ABC transporter ATP-binding protein [Candidatus Izemoplasmatales bacterium]